MTETDQPKNKRRTSRLWTCGDICNCSQFEIIEDHGWLTRERLFRKWEPIWSGGFHSDAECQTPEEFQEFNEACQRLGVEAPLWAKVRVLGVFP